MDKPVRVQGIDVEIQLVFKSEYLNLLLPHFERIGLPSSITDEMIDAYIKSGETVTYDRWILEYGQRVLNPLMNAKLKRPESHPTFNGMLLYVLKDIIDNNPIMSHFKISKIQLK
jgi:hypothetical protein